MSLIKLKVRSTPSSTITDFSIIATGWVGGRRRETEKVGKKEKADMYCGCIMTGMEDEKKPGRQKEGGMWIVPKGGGV